MPNPKKKPHIGEKLISNTFYMYLNWITLSFFSFIFWMILGKTLTPSDVGIVSTSINLVIYVSAFSTLGLTTALIKLVPEVKEKQGLKGVYPLVKLSFKPLLISLVITFLVLLLFSNQISTLVNIPYYAFLITIFSIIAISIYDVLGSALFGLQNMRKFFITDFVQVVLRVLFAGLLIFLGLSFLGPLLGFLFAYLIVLFFRFNSNYFTNEKSLSYKKLFFYASPALISAIASRFIIRGGYIILSALENTEITGLFTIAFTISSLISMLAHMPGNALLPILSALSIDKKTKKKQGYLIGLVIRYSLFLTIPLSLLLVVFSSHAVLLFSDEEFLPSTQYFLILILAAILFGLGGTFNSNLYAIGKPKLYRNIMASSSLLFLILSLILTSYFSAWGLSFAYFITRLIQFLIGFIYMRRSIKLNLFIGDLLKILFSSFVILSILFMIKPFIPDIFVLGVILFPVSLIYLGTLLFVKFYRVEDVRILRYFGERVPIFGKYILTIANFVESRL